MLSFPRGAQDKEEARWSPPPPYHTWAGASLSAVPRGAHGALAARPAALGSAPSPATGLLSALTYPQTGMAAKVNVPFIVWPYIRAPPPSQQHLIHSRATIHPL